MQGEERMVRARCSGCGSENVVTDAFAAFHYATQTWELHSTFDNAFCEECDGECRIEMVDDNDKDWKPWDK